MNYYYNLIPAGVLLAFTLLSITCCSYGQRIDYPDTRRSDHVDTYHGVEVHDPYRWMEDMKSEQTLEWISKQESIFDSFVERSSLRKSLKEKIRNFQDISRYGLPVKGGDTYFYSRTPPQQSQPVIYMQNAANGKSRELINPYRDFDSETMQLQSFNVSPGGRYLAYQVSENVSRWRKVYLVDVKSGKRLTESLAGIHSTVPVITWTPDERGFYYVRFEIPKEEEQLNAPVDSPGIYYHEVGEPQSNDKLVYEDNSNPNTLLSPTVTDDGAFLVISAREGSALENEILYKKLDGRNRIKKLELKINAAYTFLGNVETKWWLYTTANAPNGKIISIDINQPGHEYWEEVIPEDTEAAISGGSRVGGNALGVYGERIVIMYLEGVRRAVKVFDLDGNYQYDVDLPDVGSIWGGFSGRQDDNDLFYGFLGMNYPYPVYRLDLESGKSELFKSPGLNFEQSEFVTVIVYYSGRDGTEVPMFLTHRKGIKKDGSHPVFMYGYGAFGWVSFPWYHPRNLTWLELGGIFALPGIRGGGEYGEEWHKAGIGTNRQNAIDDYIAAAEWLIGRGYTSPGKMVANGGSASGMVAAAAVVQQPELFGAAIIDIPALDMLRYHKFTAAGFWIPEFGSVDEPDEFKALYSYSPYHNIQKGRCYPPTLVTVGEEDQTAVPMHGYKFIAAMQYAQDCEHPALLQVVRGAGHRFGKTPDQRARTWSDQLAYLVEVLNLNPGFTRAAD